MYTLMDDAAQQCKFIHFAMYETSANTSDARYFHLYYLLK